jgi:hypothetical protein
MDYIHHLVDRFGSPVVRGPKFEKQWIRQMTSMKTRRLTRHKGTRICAAVSQNPQCAVIQTDKMRTEWDLRCLKLWRALSSGMWRRGVWYKFTDASEERTASIFRRLSLLLVNGLLGLLLNQEDEVHSSETSANLYQNTWRHIPEESRTIESILFPMLHSYLITTNTKYMPSLHFLMAGRYDRVMFNVTQKECVSKHKTIIARVVSLS